MYWQNKWAILSINILSRNNRCLIQTPQMKHTTTEAGYSWRIYSQAGLRPRFACQFWSQCSNFLALLLSPCWPIICRMFVGLYLSTHSKDSGAVLATADTSTSGLCVNCVVWLSCVCGVMVSAVTLPDNGAATDGFTVICTEWQKHCYKKHFRITTDFTISPRKPQIEFSKLHKRLCRMHFL